MAHPEGEEHIRSVILQCFRVWSGWLMVILTTHTHTWYFSYPTGKLNIIYPDWRVQWGLSRCRPIKLSRFCLSVSEIPHPMNFRLVLPYTCPAGGNFVDGNDHWPHRVGFGCKILWWPQTRYLQGVAGVQVTGSWGKSSHSSTSCSLSQHVFSL